MDLPGYGYAKVPKSVQNNWKKLVDAGFGKDRIFLSLERRMECGIGKCGHCAVGYTFTCLHGPVFSYWDALNLPELIYT